MSYNKKNLRPTDDSTPQFQSNYSPKIKVSLTFPANSPFTKQEFRDECDINVLMSKYMSNGEIPALNQAAPQYLDVTGYDYQTAANLVAGAQSLFNELPSSLRNRFDNDPGQFLQFCSDSSNREEMKTLGLLKPESEWSYVPPAPTPTTPQASLQGQPTPNLNPTPAPE